MGNLITTSIKIDSDVWRQAKIETINRRITLTRFLDQALKAELKLSSS